MPARTVRPSSSVTRNNAFSKTSSMTPVPVESSFVRRLLLKCSVFERCENAVGDLAGRSDPIDSAKQPEFFVVRQERRGHCVVLIQTLFDGFWLVVGPMFELGVRGRGTIL